MKSQVTALTVVSMLHIIQVKCEINAISLQIETCSDSSVFDYSGLLCSSCDWAGTMGLQPDISTKRYNNNPLSCKCQSNLVQRSSNCTIESLWQGTCKEIVCSLDCISISQGPSLNQKQCIPCMIADDMKHYGQPYLDNDSNRCSCNNPDKAIPSGRNVVTKRLVEVYDDISGLPIKYDCMRCPHATAVITESLFEQGLNFFSTAGARYTSDLTTCVSCPDPNMFFDTDYKCKCSVGFILYGEASVGEQYCIKHYPTVTSGYTKVRFQSAMPISADSDKNDLIVESLTFSHLYMKAASECEYFEGATYKSLQSCQMLSNLCVMSMYDKDSPACMQLLIITRRRIGSYHKQQDWKQTLPWLYYLDDAETVMNDRGIRMKVAFNADANFYNNLSFKVATYTLNGTFTGIEDLTNQFSFCSTSTEFKNKNGLMKEPTWQTFGNSHRIIYQCNIEDLLNKQMVFYDLFIVDNSLEACDENESPYECLYPVPVLHRNLIERNIFPNMNQALADEKNDIFTRRFFLFDNKSGETTSGLYVIRFAKTIMLQIQIRSESPNKLYPPKLIIEYDNKIIAGWSENSSIEEKSELVVFRVDYSMKTDNFWESIQVVIGFIAALAVAVICVRMYNWQTRQKAVTLTSMSFMLHAVMILCQTFVMLFLPFSILICTYWFVFFKLQDSVFLLLPSNNEFYDEGNEYYFFELTFWALFYCQTFVTVYIIVKQCQSTVIFVDWERPKSKVVNKVSMWRAVLVASEWNKMQTRRKQSIEFSLILVGFFMLGLNQNRNSIPKPNFDGALNEDENIALRFANTWFFWAIASSLQWLWRFLFYERFIDEHKGQKFVDLCSVCNISMFIMTEELKGYYLHGRAPFQYSDCSMEEMLDSLKNEANGFTVGRGLDGSANSDQVFVLFSSSSFHNNIFKIHSILNIRQDDVPIIDHQSELWKKHAKADLNLFLQNFINQQPHPLPIGLKYLVREPLITERLFGLTPADFRAQNEPKCILQPDTARWNHDYSFLSTTFSGIELILLLHDILTYFVTDMIFNNSAISLFATYLMHLIRTFLASYFARKNLSEKSFIDERLLI